MHEDPRDIVPVRPLHPMDTRWVRCSCTVDLAPAHAPVLARGPRRGSVNVTSEGVPMTSSSRRSVVGAALVLVLAVVSSAAWAGLASR